MLIGGLQKLTLIDYPGKIACTVFTVGCNFRCHFCHNPELVRNLKVAATSGVGKTVAAGFSPRQTISEQKFFEFLKSRQGLLDGICITGGEPTLYRDLPEFLKKIKALGFSVKLDTNGTAPDVLEKLLKDKMLDYIAMDIKASIKVPSSPASTCRRGEAGKFQVPSPYEMVVGAGVNLGDIKRSINIIKSSGLEHEFRTTVVPGLHVKEDILDIAKFIKGAKKYYLQQFRAGEKILNQEYKTVKPYPAEFLKDLKEEIKDFFEVCEVRE